MLRALKTSGMLSWMDDARIPELSRKVRLTKPVDSKKKTTKIQPRATLYALIGPPPGTNAMVLGDGKGVIVILRTNDNVTGPITKSVEVELTPAIRSKLWTAVEQYTGIPFDPKVKDDLVNGPEDWKPTVDPGDDGIYLPISEAVLQKRYGKKVWDDYQQNKAKSDAAAGNAGVVSVGGIKFAETVPEADRKYFLEWMKQIASGGGGSPDDTTISPYIIETMRKIDAHPQKDKIREAREKGAGGAAAARRSTRERHQRGRDRSGATIRAMKPRLGLLPLFQEPCAARPRTAAACCTSARSPDSTSKFEWPRRLGCRICT
jgi:hypothetical protein